MVLPVVLMVLVALVALLAAAEAALPMPEYLKACSRNDPGLDECALRNGVAAIPHLLAGDRAYSIPPLDPLKIAEIRIEGADSKAPTGLDIVYKDMTASGLDRAQLRSTHFDLKKKQMELSILIPELRLVMQYEMDGKFLLLPIKGKGRETINMTDVDITYGLDYDLVTKPDGLEYMKPTDSRLKYKTTRMYLHLDNLFNGDKTLGENTNRFLNENWEAVDAEFGQVIAQAIGEVIKQIFSSCMDLVPYKDLFPESL
ncbi:protein takeout-like [Bacillus rossius redtenbacheri]|uniref:protein takeout-like n=1 Tax=Bacillus rossius redtenbacheri TaxID=93214 RepID=UPI002FDE22B3